MPQRILPKFLTTLILLVTLVLPANAQSNITLKVDGLESLSGQKMHALVSVRDENGVPVTGLIPANFAIVEDQKTFFPPETVTLRTNPAAGLSILLLIDLSSNMQGQPLVEAKAASQKLLETLLDQPNDPDRAAFLGLTDTADINNLAFNQAKAEVNFTNDRNLILNTLNGAQIGQAQAGGTPLYDALFRAIKLTANQPAPRAIVVLTDGLDPKKSKLSADDPIAEANRNNIPVFPIGFSGGALDNEYLTRLAARTGATYQRAPDAAKFSEIFSGILSGLSQQYVLSYQSQLKADTQPHAVIIRVEHPKGKASGESVFNFKDVPTAAPTSAPTAPPGNTAPVQGQPPAAAEPAKGETPQPAAVATPTPATPQSLVERVKTFVSDRANLPILIGVLAILLALLLLLLFLILRRSRRVEETSSYDYPPVVPEPATAGTPAVNVPTSGGDFTGTAGSIPPTAFDSNRAPGTTEYAPSSYPPGGQPSPFGTSVPPAPPAGGTVILQRGPQKQIMAMLVNRKRPQERYDVTASTDIGRATTNHIVLNNATISRQHAKIKFERDDFYLYDLGSANHSFVNEKPVTDPVVLKDGDVVRFGELEFLFKRLV
jgi:VWFA-related protein